ncbi:MAG: septum formation initiator family protein [Treponema sp.]|nr:septum formation initiator family protein [Treponema sp.]
MIKCRVLVAAVVGTLFYVCISILCGRNSLWAESQLNEQKRIMSLHAVDIEQTKEELMLEKVALEKDMDVIAAYARKLSYIRDGEKIVKISGLPAHENQIYDPGSIMFHEDVKYFPEWFCKIVGLIFFLLTYCIQFIYDTGKGFLQKKIRHRPNYYDEMHGMPSV